MSERLFKMRKIKEKIHSLLSKHRAKTAAHRKRKNSKLNQQEFDDKKIVLKSVPTTYAIGVTNICQLRCPLCISGRRQQDKKLSI